MGSSNVAQTQYQQFAFPLSPPNSGSVTTVSSPHFDNTPPNQQDRTINQHFIFPSAHHHTKFHSQPRRLQKPPVFPDVLDYDELTAEEDASGGPNHKSLARSLTLPSESSLLSIHATTPPSVVPHRTDSLSSSSTSSSSSIIHMRENGPNAGGGMGRKVAAKLQLFKESVGPTEPPLSAESSRPQSTGNRKAGPPQNGDDEEIAEAQFQFVKRSEWPEREAAAIRRERSMTTFEHGKARDVILRPQEEQLRRDHNQYQEAVQQEYNRWRRGFVESSEAKRGRRRDRASITEGETKGEDHLLPKSTPREPTILSPNSHAFPPSPSPSRSPRRLVPPQQNQPPDSNSRSHNSTWTSPSSQTAIFPSLSLIQPPSHHRSPSANISVPTSPLESPWETDGDSAWETASVATSTSALSTHARKPSEKRRPRSPALSPSATEFQSPPSSFVFKGSDYDRPLYFNLSQEHLPHIPLRPFRNQVGGHSSIYKFTKQAVCKVRNFRQLSFLLMIDWVCYLRFASLLSRERISSMKLLRWKPLLS